MTQEQVAEKSRIHPTHISNLERGKVSPNYETLQRLADGFELPSPAHIVILQEILKKKKRG